MDNATRAARLAEMGFFHIESRMAHSLSSGDGLLDGDILLSLLTELPKRGFTVMIDVCYPLGTGGFVAEVTGNNGDGETKEGRNACPLLALVDAVIAACAERRAT